MKYGRDYRNIGTNMNSDQDKNSRSESHIDVSLEQDGERRISGVLSAVDKAPWSVSLLKLAWTAGPVTYIAAQGGSYIGYKDFLPPDRLLFFIAYTVLAGVIGVVTSIVYETLHQRRQKQRGDNLTTVIDRLPELIYAVRNLRLSSIPQETRKKEAALLLLEKAELGPVGLGIAVEDLTGSSLLAETARRCEIYRRAGLSQRAHDLLEEESELISIVTKELYEVMPSAAPVLRNRLDGKGVSVKRGVPREDNFIERIFAAIEEDNPALMTLQDVEEILVLAFELINGRTIPTLTFNYRGSWPLERATDTVERVRSEYRLAQALAYSRLKALTTYLQENDALSGESLIDKTQPEMLEIIQNAFDSLCDEIYQLRIHVVAGRHSYLDDLHEKTQILDTGLELYKLILEAYKEQGRRHATLIRARQKWELLSSRRGSTRLRTGKGRYGLRIASYTIELDDEKKLEFVAAVAKPLRSLNLRRRGRRYLADGSEMRTLNSDSAKDLAVEIALALEDSIEISRPSIQRAINSSNAILLAGIEPGSSASTKAALGAAVASAVKPNLGKTAERLASALVRHYRVELSEKSMAFLNKNYGANMDTLRILAGYSEPVPAVPVSQLRSRPPSLPPLDESWSRQLRRARRLLLSYDREID